MRHIFQNSQFTKYVSECDTCQRVKASHLKVAGTLQPLPIPSWKWEDISMDFIVGLPNTSQKHDSIWVIVDRLTKTAHFIPVHTTYRARKYAEIYLERIVCLHGVPKTIISDRGFYREFTQGTAEVCASWISVALQQWLAHSIQFILGGSATAGIRAK